MPSGCKHISMGKLVFKKSVCSSFMQYCGQHIYQYKLVDCSIQYAVLKCLQGVVGVVYQ